MLLDAPGALSQASPAAQNAMAKHGVETSVSIGGFAQLTATRIENASFGGFITQSLHPSAGVLFSFRQSFRPWVGYSLNFGYTKASEHNTNGAGQGLVGTYANFYVPNNVYELSVSHLAQKHLTQRLTGFTEEGAGFLAYQPTQSGAAGTNPTGALGTSFRPLIVFGAGADYHFNAQWALRGEFRGLLHKYPDYGQTIPRLITISSEPTVSMTYTFGAKQRASK
jgi:hypothetical protein